MHECNSKMGQSLILELNPEKEEKYEEIKLEVNDFDREKHAHRR